MATVLNQRVTWRFAAPIVVDGALVLSSIVLSTLVMADVPGWGQAGLASMAARVGVLAIVCHLCLYYADLYDARSSGNVGELVVRLMQSLGVTAVLLAVVYTFQPALVVGRGVFALTVGLLLALVPVWRAGFDIVVDRLAPSERILILGTKPAAVGLARELMDRQREFGAKVVGFVDADAARVRGRATRRPGHRHGPRAHAHRTRMDRRRRPSRPRRAHPQRHRTRATPASPRRPRSTSGSPRSARPQAGRPRGASPGRRSPAA